MENVEKLKRRSFVDARRKSLVISQMFSEDTSSTTCNDNTVKSMKEYIEHLQKELDQWNLLIKERKRQCSDCMVLNECEPLVIKENLVKCRLSAEDKRFLDERPNYFEVLQCAKKLKFMLLNLEKYKREGIEYYEEIADEIDKETNIMANEMCSDDLCDLCNTQSCTILDHKLININN